MRSWIITGFILLAAGGAGFWWWTQNGDDAKAKREATFKVDDIGSITKIVLTREDKEQSTLTKTDAGWMVNNKYAARQELTDQLLDAIKRIETLSPVPKRAHDNVLKEMLQKNIRVEIYTGKDKPERVYFVGGPTLDNAGTYMIQEIDGKPASRPYIIYVPGLQGYVTSRYATNPEVWRSRAVFNTDPARIQAVTISYKDKPTESFTIAKNAADSLTFYTYDNKIPQPQPKQAFLKVFTSYINTITVETYANSSVKRDSILKQAPYASIKVVNKDKSTQTVNLYYQEANKRSKREFDEKGNEVLIDVDRLWVGLNENKDFAVGQYVLFGKLLRKPVDFFIADITKK
jgi:hypothetical protein